MSRKFDSVLEIQAYIVSLLVTECQLPATAIEVDKPLIDLGINSMIAVSINAHVVDAFGMDLPFERIANNASIEDLAHYFYHQSMMDVGQFDWHKMLQNEVQDELVNATLWDESIEQIKALDRSFYDIKLLPQYKKLRLQKSLFKRAEVELPYFRRFNSSSTDLIGYEDRQLINFASYNYLGYNDDERVNFAAKAAISQYGTSASSSRLVSGEKTIHHELEQMIAALYNVDDALVFVSGYATNVGVISHLMDRNDLIIHDSLAHNSIVMGSQFSKSKRLKFPHNDLVALEEILRVNRLQYERVLIIVEGLYSMDGDTPLLAELVAIKKRYKCLLMVDEAHSIGVLGETGRGLREHCDVAATDVDIWMGTLSKSFAGCGGYIAGCAELIDFLKFTAPGFIFSVALAPPLAGASLKAIELLMEDNDRVKQLQKNSQYFLKLAKQKGFNTGLAEGYAIIPIIFGHSLNTAKIANNLFADGINVQSIIYPGVEELSARLRFFVSALHSEVQIESAINTLEKYYFEQVGKLNEHCDSTR